MKKFTVYRPLDLAASETAELKEQKDKETLPAGKYMILGKILLQGT
jgi:hypothetical protein